MGLISSRQRAGDVVTSDTVPVTVSIRSIHPIVAGRLLGLAAVAIEIAEVELVIRGLQILRDGAGKIGVVMPSEVCPLSSQDEREDQQQLRCDTEPEPDQHLAGVQ